MASGLITIGEILIDLTQTGRNASGVPLYAANPGGAPANVAVAAARMGAETGFIGCVGRDSLGELLRETLRSNGVDLTGLTVTDRAPTSLAVVSLDRNGERSYSFYRDPGADLFLEWKPLPGSRMDQAGILHFGSVSLTGEPSASAVLSAVHYARSRGMLVTYDPNYRPNLWDSPGRAAEAMREPLPLVDVIKLSEEETLPLTGTADPEKAASCLEGEGIPLVLVTLGADGVLCRYRNRTETVPGFPVAAADTNGAGDSFFGAFLSCLCGRGGTLKGLEWEELRENLRFSNCAASLTAGRPGAIPALPYLEEVRNALSQKTDE